MIDLLLWDFQRKGLALNSANKFRAHCASNGEDVATTLQAIHHTAIDRPDRDKRISLGYLGVRVDFMR